MFESEPGSSGPNQDTMEYSLVRYGRVLLGQACGGSLTTTALPTKFIGESSPHFEVETGMEVESMNRYIRLLAKRPIGPVSLSQRTLSLSGRVRCGAEGTGLGEPVPSVLP